MDESPVLNASLVTAAVGAVIAVATAFWPGLVTEEQKNVILGAIPVFWVLIVALAALIRPRVTPNPQVQRELDMQWNVAKGKVPASRYAVAAQVQGLKISSDVQPTRGQLAYLIDREHEPAP